MLSGGGAEPGCGFGVSELPEGGTPLCKTGAGWGAVVVVVVPAAGVVVAVPAAAVVGVDAGFASPVIAAQIFESFPVAKA